MNPFDPRLPRLLVLASTYPRWPDDPEPGFVHELAKRLTGRFEVTVLSPHASGALTEETLEGVCVRRYRYAPACLESLVNNGGIVTNLKRQPWKWLLVPSFLLMQAWAAWRLIRRWRPDVIHAHWLLPQGLLVALLGLIERRTPPFLVTSHGADLFALRTRPLQALKRFVAHRAAAITVVSEAMRDELTQIGVNPGKIAVRPMGVDLSERFSPDPSVQRSRNEILFVGRLVEKKGLRHLIDAMPAILATHPDAFLIVVGFGPEETECRAQAERLGLTHKVRFVGALSQAELPALYRRAQIVAFPSVVAGDGDQEGLGLVPIEALGCECAVVASDLPAVRETIIDNVTGLMAKPGSPDALAAQLRHLLDTPDLRTRLGSRGRQHVLRFDWTHTARAYADLIRSVMPQSRPSGVAGRP